MLLQLVRSVSNLHDIAITEVHHRMNLQVSVASRLCQVLQSGIHVAAHLARSLLGSFLGHTLGSTIKRRQVLFTHRCICKLQEFKDHLCLSYSGRCIDMMPGQRAHDIKVEIMLEAQSATPQKLREQQVRTLLLSSGAGKKVKGLLVAASSTEAAPFSAAWPGLAACPLAVAGIPGPGTAPSAAAAAALTFS